MQRTWATGSAHDDKPLDWLFDLRYAKDLGHLTEALQAALDNGSVGACQTALLAAECVGWLRGAPADLHDDARRWLVVGGVSAGPGAGVAGGGRGTPAAGAVRPGAVGAAQPSAARSSASRSDRSSASV
jgi:hypothetical protein